MAATPSAYLRRCRRDERQASAAASAAAAVTCFKFMSSAPPQLPPNTPSERSPIRICSPSSGPIVPRCVSDAGVGNLEEGAIVLVDRADVLAQIYV